MGVPISLARTVLTINGTEIQGLANRDDAVSWDLGEGLFAVETGRQGQHIRTASGEQGGTMTVAVTTYSQGHQFLGRLFEACKRGEWVANSIRATLRNLDVPGHSVEMDDGFVMSSTPASGQQQEAEYVIDFTTICEFHNYAVVRDIPRQCVAA